MVRASSVSAAISWDHAATYQVFLRNVVCVLIADAPYLAVGRSPMIARIARRVGDWENGTVPLRFNNWGTMLGANRLTLTQGATHAPTQAGSFGSRRRGGDRVRSRRSGRGGRIPRFWPRPVVVGTRVVRCAGGGHAAACHPLHGRVRGGICRAGSTWPGIWRRPG